MRIAVVGSSHLEEDEREEVERFIETLVRRNQSAEIITGDAETGVDHLVRLWTPRNMLRVVESEGKQWKYFKERNKKIAQSSDFVYSITTKTKDEKCYHCNEEHQRTGGCWTLKYAKMIGKQGEVIVI